jgi:GNAT superfamily N-acetyltransferase
VNASTNSKLGTRAPWLPATHRPERSLDRTLPVLPFRGVFDSDTGGWKYGRRLGGRPELEWSFSLFTERAWVLSGRLPRLYYETLTTFDAAVYALWLGSELAGEPGRPAVILGFKYFDGCYRAPGGRLGLPAPREPFRGRHSVSLVGMDDGDLVFSNSWGEHWGSRGLGVMSRTYFERYVDNVMVLWMSSTGSSPAMFEALKRGLGRRSRTRIEDFKKYWATPNDASETDTTIGRKSYTLLRWSVVSLEGWEEVEVFEMRNPFRTFARAHLWYSNDGGPAVVKELFVDPVSRRRGVGAFLEAALCEAARERKASAIELWRDEADGYHPDSDQVETFFHSRGWSWEPVDRTRPVITAIARKELT